MSIKRFCFVLVLSFLGAAFFTAYIMLPAIDHNSQEEDCVITARLSKVADRPDNTYVKIDGQYQLYKQDMKLKNNATFYIQREGSPYSIHESNWISQHRLCKLRNETLRYGIKLFCVSFILLTVIAYLPMIISVLWRKIYKHIFASGGKG